MTSPWFNVILDDYGYHIRQTRIVQANKLSNSFGDAICDQVVQSSGYVFVRSYACVSVCVLVGILVNNSDQNPWGDKLRINV